MKSTIIAILFCFYNTIALSQESDNWTNDESMWFTVNDKTSSADRDAYYLWQKGESTSHTNWIMKVGYFNNTTGTKSNQRINRFRLYSDVMAGTPATENNYFEISNGHMSIDFSTRDYKHESTYNIFNFLNPLKVQGSITANKFFLDGIPLKPSLWINNDDELSYSGTINVNSMNMNHEVKSDGEWTYDLESRSGNIGYRLGSALKYGTNNVTNFTIDVRDVHLTKENWQQGLEISYKPNFSYADVKIPGVLHTSGISGDTGKLQITSNEIQGWINNNEKMTITENGLRVWGNIDLVNGLYTVNGKPVVDNNSFWNMNSEKQLSYSGQVNVDGSLMLSHSTEAMIDTRYDLISNSKNIQYRLGSRIKQKDSSEDEDAPYVSLELGQDGIFREAIGFDWSATAGEVETNVNGSLYADNLQVGNIIRTLDSDDRLFVGNFTDDELKVTSLNSSTQENSDIYMKKGLRIGIQSDDNLQPSLIVENKNFNNEKIGIVGMESNTPLYLASNISKLNDKNFKALKLDNSGRMILGKLQNEQNVQKIIDEKMGSQTKGNIFDFYCENGILIHNNDFQIGISDAINSNNLLSGWIGTVSNHPFSIGVGGSPTIFTTAENKVGIGGELNPKYTLDVKGIINASGFMINGQPLQINGQAVQPSDGDFWHTEVGRTGIGEIYTNNYVKINVPSNVEGSIGTLTSAAVGDGIEVISSNGDNQSGTTMLANSNRGWIGTSTNHPLYLGTNGIGSNLYLDVKDNVFVGFENLQSLEVNKQIYDNYDLFVNNGILSEDYALAPSSEWSWPDYVFKDSYTLISLEKLSQYISQNKSLPNIPNHAEIQKEGYNLHKMNILFLEKIEELTLYTIEQEKQINAQQSQNNKQDELITSLNNRIKKLELIMSSLNFKE